MRRLNNATKAEYDALLNRFEGDGPDLTVNELIRFHFLHRHAVPKNKLNEYARAEYEILLKRFGGDGPELTLNELIRFRILHRAVEGPELSDDEKVRLWRLHIENVEGSSFCLPCVVEVVGSVIVLCHNGAPIAKRGPPATLPWASVAEFEAALINERKKCVAPYEPGFIEPYSLRAMVERDAKLGPPPELPWIVIEPGYAVRDNDGQPHRPHVMVERDGVIVQ
jgi:hypothetical protein